MNRIQKAVVTAFGATGIALAALATEDTNPQDFTAGISVAKPNKECYDFSNLTEGTRYDMTSPDIQADKALIEMKKFFVEKGQPTQMADPFIEVRGSAIAREDAPELWMNQMTVKVTPNRPVNRVSIQFAENVNSLLANVAVNGKRKIVKGGLAKMNGKTLGRRNGPKAAFIVNYDSTSTGGGYNRGELRFHATNGKIRDWAIGGQHLFIDNVCFE